MNIRKARPTDSLPLAQLMMLAMDDVVYAFIGQKSREKAISFLNTLIQQEGNQYSFQNCWVVESAQEVVGMANVYNGALLHQLRAPVAAQVQAMFNRNFSPEDETQPGEFYIDCIGVREDQQGKGVGSRLFNFLIEEYAHKQQVNLGLLVDKDNPKAKQLYLRIGFQLGNEMKLAGKEMEHLQYQAL